MLTDMTIKDFCALLASKEPAPGGGSVSALAGTMAAGLGLMVIGLTAGKKAYLALPEDDKKALLACEKTLKDDYDRLMKLTDEDTESYNAFMAARAMPKDDPSRAEAIANSSLVMTETPLETCKLCLSVLESLQTVKRLGNKNAASDAGVGERMAYAGLKGSAMNVYINLPSISDEGKRDELSAAAKDIARRADGILHAE